MDNNMKGIIELLKELRSPIIKEELQNIDSQDYVDETDLINEPDLPPEVVEDEGDFYDPNLMFSQGADMGFEQSIEQKKTLLIEYMSKLLNKITVISDHIDMMSFDSVIDNVYNISTSEIQFNLEELRDKVIKYIEDQFETDKYERSLYLYLSFMEELKLIVKLLKRQANKKNKK